MPYFRFSIISVNGDVFYACTHCVYVSSDERSVYSVKLPAQRCGLSLVLRHRGRLRLVAVG